MTVYWNVATYYHYMHVYEPKSTLRATVIAARKKVYKLTYNKPKNFANALFYDSNRLLIRIDKHYNGKWVTIQ